IESALISAGIMCLLTLMGMGALCRMGGSTKTILQALVVTFFVGSAVSMLIPLDALPLTVAGQVERLSANVVYLVNACLTLATFYAVVRMQSNQDLVAWQD